MTDLSVRDAYLAMFAFLEAYYQKFGFDELGGLLGDMSLLQDGSTADQAVWGDWLEAVEKVRRGEVDALLTLGEPHGDASDREIEILYQTWDSDEVVRVRLTPEEYFDPLEPGETYEADAIPRYNQTWEYLEVPLNSLKWASERVSGTDDDKTFFIQYLDGGRSWLSHRIDLDGYEEMIHSTQIGDRSWHIIRTVKPQGAERWVVCLNSVVDDQDDGSQAERRFDEPWTSAAMKSYAKTPRDVLP